MRKKINNIYYAPIFTFDVDNINLESKSVGIDLRYKKYVLEKNKEMNRSAVSWCESEYENITYPTMLDCLDKAYEQGKVIPEQYDELKGCEEPKLSTIKDIEKVYKRIAESSIYESKRVPIICPDTQVNSNNYYVNYRYKETHPFTKFYLNRYSLNHGWCVRISKNDIGYKLLVIYSPKKLPELFENKAMDNFLNKYYSDPEVYYSMDVKEKQLTNWEFAYILDLLKENNIYGKLKPCMDIDKTKSIGYTGPCSFKILYDEAFIEGEAAIDSKECCGVDFFGIIQKLNNM